MIRPNEQGLIKCPNCKKYYKPILERKTDQLIQIEFPDSKPYEREQLISGLCSDKCFNEFLNFGSERIINYDDEK